MPATEDISGASGAGDAIDSGVRHGSYALTGPLPRGGAGSLPMRGDLAHIALAGKFFVPHYAVPQPRTVLPGGAPLMTQPGEAGEELRVLAEGEIFEVLEVGESWAWGCLSLAGPVGWVRLDRLELLR